MSARRRRIFRWLRIFVGVGLLAALIFIVDVNAIASSLGRTRPEWLGLSAALIVAATLLGACNLYLLLDRKADVRIGSFLRIYWVGWATNLFMPGQVGDIAGISALLRSYGIPLHVSISRSLVDKVLSVVAIACMGALGIWLHVRSSSLENIFADLRFAAMPAVVMGLVVVLVVVLLLARILWRNSGRIGTFARHMVRDIWLTASLHPRRIAANLALSVVKMALTGLAYWCAFSALGYYDASPIAVILLAAASSLVAYIPISFNGLGTVELAGVALFGSLGIPPQTVVAAYLLLRAIVLVLACTPLALGLAVAPAKSA